MLTDYSAWTALAAHYAKIRDVHLRRLFAADPMRGERSPRAAAFISTIRRIVSPTRRSIFYCN
jgi:hypothetical protein